MKSSISIVAISFLSYAYAVSEICRTPGEACLHFEQCPQHVQDMVTMDNIPPHILKQLKEAVCGVKKLKKICCAKPPAPPPQPECHTWDGRPGECVDASTRDKSMSNRQLKFSRCTKRKGRFICHSNLPVTQSKECKTSTFPTDPSFGCCGKQKYAPDKIIGGELTGLDEFPWLVVLKYEEDKKNCSGALISDRYVLTAAHCLDYSSLKPYAVVLGEHDKSSKNDSFESEYRGPVEVTIGIEEIIVHEDFDPTDERGRNDIALIRLMKKATYSDFVQPICLPTGLSDMTKNPPANFKLWSAGWGDINATSPSPSDIKRKVLLPFVDPYTCIQSIKSLNSAQLCAGGEVNKDSCSGDSGSPLVYDRTGTFEVIGVTSHSYSECGTEGTPAVYTKVHSYLSWIQAHIRL